MSSSSLQTFSWIHRNCGDVSQLAQPLALDDAEGRGSIAGYSFTQLEAEVAGHGQHAQCLGRTFCECLRLRLSRAEGYGGLGDPPRLHYVLSSCHGPA